MRQCQQKIDEQHVDQDRHRGDDAPERGRIARDQRRRQGRVEQARSSAIERKQKLFSGFEAPFRIERDRAQDQSIEPDRDVGPNARQRGRIMPVARELVRFDVTAPGYFDALRDRSPGRDVKL